MHAEEPRPLIDVNVHSRTARFMRAGTDGLWRFLYRLESEGAHRIPAEGSCIIAANHPSYLDPMSIALCTGRTVHYLAWDKPFDIPGVGMFMRTFGAIPVDAEGGASLASMRATLGVLRTGRVFGIFPEGGRSVNRRLRPFKNGAAKLSLQTGAPLVPTSVRGALAIWPSEHSLPRPYGRITVVFHPPIYPPENTPDKRRAIKDLNDRLREAILSAADYGAE